MIVTDTWQSVNNVTVKPVVSFWIERYRGVVWALLEDSLANIKNLTDTTTVLQLSTGGTFTGR